MYIQSFSSHTVITLHSVMLVGIGIATNQPLGTESSCLKVSNLQSLLEQVTIKVLLAEFGEKPPIIACPLPNVTISCPKSGLGKVGPAKSWIFFFKLVKNNWNSETYRIEKARKHTYHGALILVLGLTKDY